MSPERTVHERFMREALSLATKGRGLVSPNPMVGAVVVRGRTVVGRGWHRAFGLPHAETEALAEAGVRAKGATVYVNLEPCCHTGKTPPCTGALLAAGVSEVVCAMEDPNPLVAGKGVEILRDGGVGVRCGILEDEARRLNRAFAVRMAAGRPYVVLKWAQSLDGRIAPASREPRRITGDDARSFLGELRFECDAILVGVGTLLADNPRLDYRTPVFQAKKAILARKRYRKVVLDALLRTPLEGRIWENPDARVTIVCSERAEPARVAALAARGADVIAVPETGGLLDLPETLRRLGELDVGVLLVEGGQKVLTSFWEARLADRVMIFVGNTVLGGAGALPPLAGADAAAGAGEPRLADISVRRFGEDILIEGDPCFPA